MYVKYDILAACGVSTSAAQPDQPFAQGRPLLALFREAYCLVAAHAAQGIRLWTAAGMSSATRTIGIPVWIA